jgi:hypothetical protein
VGVAVERAAGRTVERVVRGMGRGVAISAA